MSLEDRIFVRYEALQRLLWEKVQEWRWRPQDNPIGRAVAYYPFDENLDIALQQMTEAELRFVVLHERGEIKAGVQLGAGWSSMLQDIAYHRAEMIARAVRDHLADSLVTLPVLLTEAEAPSIHYYFANFDGFRRELFPSLYQAYQTWHQSGAIGDLVSLSQQGQGHWLELAQKMISLHQQYGEESGSHIAQLQGMQI